MATGALGQNHVQLAVAGIYESKECSIYHTGTMSTINIKEKC